MAITVNQMVAYLREIYTLDELKELFNVSIKSIDNYTKGLNPNKKKIAEIKHHYNKIKDNKGIKIDVRELLKESSGKKTINDTDEYLATKMSKIEAMLELILNLIAHDKAQSLGRDPSSLMAEYNKLIRDLAKSNLDQR